MQIKAPYDGFYNVKYYYADPATNYSPEAKPVLPMTLMNVGGSYLPIASSVDYWQQHAPGQVVVPTTVGYYDDGYMVGNPNVSFAPTLKYGTEPSIIQKVLPLIVGILLIGLAIYLYKKM